MVFLIKKKIGHNLRSGWRENKMASTYICKKCGTIFRTASPIEYDLFILEHKSKCNGKFESIWKNYDKMTLSHQLKLGVSCRSGIHRKVYKGIIPY